MKLNRMQIAILIIVMHTFTINTVHAQKLVNPTATIPSDTDPRISTFNAPQYSWLPTSSPRNQLLLFLLGTGGPPKNRFPFLKTAAELGYHVIEIGYPNSIPASACQRSRDPYAYIKFRLAIIRGGNISQVINVSRVDSIENRVQQFLRYLAVHQPNMGWDQFLSGNGQIEWQKICVAGQSQGGGHAFVISKFYEVARVIMTGSPKDYSIYFHGPAKGYDTHTKTPLDRYFAFNHLRDELALCDHAKQMQILEQMGVTQFGVVNADHCPPDFNHAHIIVTNAQFTNETTPEYFHFVPLSGDISFCRPVWEYMLTEPVQ